MAMKNNQIMKRVFRTGTASRLRRALTLTLSLALTLALVAALAAPSAMARIEEPAFDTVKSSGDFEVRHYDEGFRPDQKDGRGCTTTGCTCDDTDGDGLSSQVELYLHTKDTLMDTDGDGIPDGIEARYGLDPLKRTAAGLDTDGDGLPDSLEIRSDTNPIKRDNVFFDKEGYQYETRAEEQPNKSMCYDFSVTNLKLVTPPKKAGFKQGYNLFKVYFAQSPESGVATDYGIWRVACAWAQYDPPSVRVPAAADLAFQNRDFKRPPNLVTPAQYANPANCIGTPP